MRHTRARLGWVYLIPPPRAADFPVICIPGGIAAFAAAVAQLRALAMRLPSVAARELLLRTRTQEKRDALLPVFYPLMVGPSFYLEVRG